MYKSLLKNKLQRDLEYKQTVIFFAWMGALVGLAIFWFITEVQPHMAYKVSQA